MVRIQFQFDPLLVPVWNNSGEINQVSYSYLNKVNTMPDDFDWLADPITQPDLTQIKSYQDAVRHFKEHGHRESRHYGGSIKSNRNQVSNDRDDGSRMTFDYSPSPPDRIKDLPSDFADWVAYYAQSRAQTRQKPGGSDAALPKFPATQTDFAQRSFYPNDSRDSRDSPITLAHVCPC